jgi:hypothetical protein
MMKLIKTLSLLLLMSTAGFCQNEAPNTDKTLFFVKGGVGTSWITMPKVFLLDSTIVGTDSTFTSAQILPATNRFSGYVGFQTVIPLGKHWLFMPEIDINFIAGDIRVDLTTVSKIVGETITTETEFSQKLQSYTRIEVPLSFGVISSDNFWVSFGPVLFFTLSDNKGFDTAVDEVRTNPVNIDSDNPFGIRFRLAAYIIVAKGMYIDVKFDSDLDRDFYFTESDEVYHMKMSLQSITVGFAYRFNRAGL